MTRSPTSNRTRQIDGAALDVLFRNARSFNGWGSESISLDDIQELYELAKLGPTSANGNPARFVWVHSEAAKTRLSQCVKAGNVQKILSAAVVAVIGFDTEFHDHFQHLMPFAADKYREAFAASEQERYDTAFRNSSLQGAYLIMAARALGYDCGPISGFEHELVNAALFAGTSVRANFLCCIGQGAAETLMPRNPRFDFQQINTVI
jgi:3-hydroxypropanoate dehydrogenase